MGQITPASAQPRLQVLLEREQQFGRRLVENQQGWALIAGRASRDGEAGREGLKLHGVAVGHRRRHGWGAGLSAADQAWREAVEEAGQQAAAAEPGSVGQALEDFWLDAEADGQTWPLDVLGGRPRRSTLSRSPAWPLR
jgi:hypothetical protein